MKSAWTFAFALVLCGAALPASAQGREHDGFMLRLTAGLGFGGMSTDQGPGEPLSRAERVRGVEFSLTGVAGAFAFDVGGSPIHNLVIHGRFSFLSLTSPTLSVNDQELGDIDDASVSMLLFAPAVTYYFMPVNIYLTGAAGFALAGITYDDGDRRESGATDLGWGINLDAGIEFWLGQAWAIGPALRLLYISVPDDDNTDDPPIWNGLGLTALFSATFQ
jgi:hypothetical protein